MRVWGLSVAALWSATVPLVAIGQTPADPPDRSHSAHGEAFDAVPRQFARKLSGIGNVHFPVTTKSPEAQRYFDQGLNLAYSFWWYESQRAFRHAAMVDPDCAMAYWGLALSTAERGFGENKEATAFMKVATGLKAKATDRERRYIDVYTIAFGSAKEHPKAREDYEAAMKGLIAAYPKDNEAKALYGWRLAEWNLGATSAGRPAADAMLRQVLAVNPQHPGANHMRIHLWDRSDSAQALDSCKAYTASVPNIGHAQHMPGHIYSQLGMWEQAVVAMDSGARVERRYMFQQGRMPFQTWNYSHNEDYIIACLGSMGRIADGMAESQELLRVPGDPFNDGYWDTADGGRMGLTRMLIRGERWDDILTANLIKWPDNADANAFRLYLSGMANLGKGNLPEAAKVSAELDALAGKNSSNNIVLCTQLELRGRVRVAKGETDAGLGDLKSAHEKYASAFHYNDPHPYPRPIAESYVWGLLQAKRFENAISVATDSLKPEPNNPYVLAMLAEAQLRAGHAAAANQTAARVKQIWRYADADLPALVRFQSLLHELEPGGSWSPQPWDRSKIVASFGPDRWQPFPAPELKLTTADGRSLKIADFHGKNLLLVFYLDGTCPHCMKQLDMLAKDKAAFTKLNTEIVAASADTPQTNREFLNINPGYALTLASDPGHQAAKRYGAYDDFESKELHATYLIDASGKVWWFRAGTSPFTDLEPLKKEIARMNGLAAGKQTTK